MVQEMSLTEELERLAAGETSDEADPEAPPTPVWSVTVIGAQLLGVAERIAA